MLTDMFTNGSQVAINTMSFVLNLVCAEITNHVSFWHYKYKSAGNIEMLTVTFELVVLQELKLCR